jgi:hypothetical protein
LDIKQQFGVRQNYRAGLFDGIPPRPVSDWLRLSLSKNFAFAMNQGTEKARSEYVIAPVFAELHEQSQERASIFSGVEFNVDKKQGLSGFCDFLVSRSSYQAALEAPVVVAVEAKRQDFEKGLAQCTAEMIAARIYNERAGNDVGAIYGCVTTGDIWRFLVLHGNLAEIESQTFDITTDIEQILGILWAMTFGEIEPQRG